MAWRRSTAVRNAEVALMSKGVGSQQQRFVECSGGAQIFNQEIEQGALHAVNSSYRLIDRHEFGEANLSLRMRLLPLGSRSEKAMQALLAAGIIDKSKWLELARFDAALFPHLAASRIFEAFAKGHFSFRNAPCFVAISTNEKDL